MQRSRTRRPSSGRGSRSDTPTLDAEDVRRARAETRRVLGGELEAKATDEFCVHVAVPRQPITLIERASTTAGRPAEHLRRIGIAAAPVQACWLNRTIRAESEATVLGDVAGDDRVELVDVPRPLVPEALGVTLEAAAAIRKGTHLT